MGKGLRTKVNATSGTPADDLDIRTVMDDADDAVERQAAGV